MLLAPGRAELSTPAKSAALESLAVLSTVVPPSPSGQSRVLQHVIVGSGADCLWLTDQPDAGAPGMRVRQLSAPDAIVPSIAEARTRSLLGQMMMGAARRAAEIVEALRAARVRALIACSGADLDLPAAWIAAGELGIPLIVWLFDDPVYQWPAGERREFAAWGEHLWAPAAAVIAPNEQLVDDFAARQRVRPAIVRNPITPEAFPVATAPWPAGPGPIRIVYTGSVYHAQADAFRNLLAAIAQLDGRFELHIHTHQSAEELASHGVGGDGVMVHDFVRDAAVYAEQQSADVLFLPLAFGSDIQEVLRSSAPAKLGEYLASGRPLLVHAPADSFVCRHVATHRAGMVVDRPEPGLLVQALETIAADAARRDAMVARASRLAREYRVERAREAFAEVVGRAVSSFSAARTE